MARIAKANTVPKGVRGRIVIEVVKGTGATRRQPLPPPPPPLLPLPPLPPLLLLLLLPLLPQSRRAKVGLHLLSATVIIPAKPTCGAMMMAMAIAMSATPRLATVGAHTVLQNPQGRGQKSPRTESKRGQRIGRSPLIIASPTAVRISIASA